MTMTREEQDAYSSLLAIVIIACLYSLFMVVYYAMILRTEFENQSDKQKVLDDPMTIAYIVGCIVSIGIFLFAVFGGRKSLNFFRRKLIR